MINYYSDHMRDTPINLFVARVLVSCLMLWKLVVFDWGVYPQWPTSLTNYVPAFRSDWLFPHIEYVALLCGIGLVAVLLGYRLRFSTLFTAVLLAYLGTVRHNFQLSHSSRMLMLGALFLVIFGVWAEEDKLTVDQLRRTRSMSLPSLQTHLEDRDLGGYEMNALRWILVVMGIFYFHAGVTKLAADPVNWIQPENLARFLVYRNVEGPSYFLSDVLLASDTLLVVASVGTIALETLFLVAILTKKPVWPLILAIIGLHLAILFSLGPAFLDVIVLLCMFLPWDTLVRKAQPNSELDIVYDEHCFFCARSLHLFKFIDANGSVDYQSQYDTPEQIVEDLYDFDDAMFAFNQRESYKGYWAFVELLSHLRITAIFAALMRLPAVSHVGERVYSHVAENRSRYFVCSVAE